MSAIKTQFALSSFNFTYPLSHLVHELDEEHFWQLFIALLQG
jgi:hypothetical protein